MVKINLCRRQIPRVRKNPPLRERVCDMLRPDWEGMRRELRDMVENPLSFILFGIVS